MVTTGKARAGTSPPAQRSQNWDHLHRDRAQCRCHRYLVLTINLGDMASISIHTKIWVLTGGKYAIRMAITASVVHMP